MKKLVKQSLRYTQKRWKDILNCEEDKNMRKKNLKIQGINWSLDVTILQDLDIYGDSALFLRDLRLKDQ